MKSDSHQSSKSWRTDWSNPWSKLSCCKLKVSGARFGSWCSLWCIFWRYWVGETFKSVDGGVRGWDPIQEWMLGSILGSCCHENSSSWIVWIESPIFDTAEGPKILCAFISFLLGFSSSTGEVVSDPTEEFGRLSLGFSESLETRDSAFPRCLLYGQLSGSHFKISASSHIFLSALNVPLLSSFDAPRKHYHD